MVVDGRKRVRILVRVSLKAQDSSVELEMTVVSVTIVVVVVDVWLVVMVEVTVILSGGTTGREDTTVVVRVLKIVVAEVKCGTDADGEGNTELLEDVLVGTVAVMDVVKVKVVLVAEGAVMLPELSFVIVLVIVL